MDCRNCGLPVAKNDLDCPNCGVTTAKEKADLQRIDPAMTNGLAWALIAVGLLGVFFVVANSRTEWQSSLDFVAPAALLLVGGATLISTRRKK